MKIGNSTFSYQEWADQNPQYNYNPVGYLTAYAVKHGVIFYITTDIDFHYLLKIKG